MARVAEESTSGVGEAPRYEVAGCRAPTGLRALWGFERNAALDCARAGERGVHGSKMLGGIKG